MPVRERAVSIRLPGRVALVSLTVAPCALAHEGGPPQQDWWNLDPWVLVPLALAMLWFWVGFGLFWRRAGGGRVPGAGRAGCFAAGMLALGLALVWPFDVLSERSFAAHMIQHMLLFAIAPPLLVLARPLPVYLLALPRRLRRMLVCGFRRGPNVVWSQLVRPGVAFALHGVTLWIWHAPFTFNAALEDRAIHFAEHASFLFTALLFWWSLLRTRPAHPVRYAASAFWLLSTLMHSGFLGALLTFAPRPLYALYGREPTAGELLWGLTVLEDQQLAGVIMWVPAGLVYLLSGLTLIAFWLRGLEQERDGLA